MIGQQNLSNSQQAYLNGKSAESAFPGVIGYHEHCIEYREYTLVVFLNIEGSFNIIETKAIKESVREVHDGNGNTATQNY